MSVEISVAEDLRRDAERWRALMSSARMHFMGSAGFDHQVVDGKRVATPRPGKVWHFGMEFWSEHPASNDRRYPDDFERELLTTYADQMRARSNEERARSLGAPYRLALRWVAGRDIPRSRVADAAVDYLIRIGWVKAEAKRDDNVSHYDALSLTADGQAALAIIEGAP